MTANQGSDTAREKRREYPEPLSDPLRKLDAMQRFPIECETVTHLRGWFVGRKDTLIAGHGYLCTDRDRIFSFLVPDIVIAFGVNPDRIIKTNGYVMSDVGKPPEFILDFASMCVSPIDYKLRLQHYAAMGVQEYWRFDQTGGKHSDILLAGYRLSEGAFAPVALEESLDGEVRGYSPTLQLYLCWVNRKLEFFDPAKVEYLPDTQQLLAQIKVMKARRIEAEARRINAQIYVDRALRLQAEAERRMKVKISAPGRQADARLDETWPDAKRLSERLRRL